VVCRLFWGERRDPDDRILSGHGHTFWGNMAGSCAQRGECSHWITTRSAFARSRSCCEPVTPQTLGRPASDHLGSQTGIRLARPSRGGRASDDTRPRRRDDGDPHCTRTEMGTAAGRVALKKNPPTSSNRGEGRGPLRARARAWGALNGRALKLFDRSLGRGLSAAVRYSCHVRGGSATARCPRGS
jgi:hypothetical protein